MHLTCKYMLFMSFPALCIVSVLMLVAPQMGAADSHLPRGQQLDELTLVCSEWRRPERVARPSELHSFRAGDNGFKPWGVHQPLTGKNRWVELHVPAALLKTLQTTERGDAVIELQVPAALLTLLQTVELEELP